MKREFKTIALVAMGILVAASLAAAQDKPAATSGGQVTVQTLTVDDINSSKFQEYKDVVKGFSMPHVNIFATGSAVDFNLNAYNVSQKDQRYAGWANFSWIDFGFDYNQIVHRMGNNAHVIYSETSPGVWTMPSSLRTYYSNTVDAALPTSVRTFDFYNALLAPSFDDSIKMDLTSLRKHGEYTFDLSKSLPFDLKFTYTHERKDGYRGAGGGDIVSGPVSPVVDVPETMNELTQDYAIKFEYRFKNNGNIHAALVKNVYTNNVTKQLIDNPFRPSDLAYTAAAGAVPAYGGPGTIMISGTPDNDALNTSAGILLKFAKQTRLAADVTMGQYKQNAPFLPYTSNTTVLTAAGQNASLASALQASSFNGKIDTQTFNVWFTSRPVDNLGIRLSYRSWDLTNKTSRYVITGDLSGSPDRSWGSADAPTADAPYGHGTALNYDNSAKKFQASLTYDIGALTLEGLYRSTKLERTFREAASGKDNGYNFAALFHAADWMGVRLAYDESKRTADGTTIYGFQADEAERKIKRTSVDVEFEPMEHTSLTLAYFQRDVTYPGRPDRAAISSNVIVGGPFAGTPSGLLSAKYNGFSVDYEIEMADKVELGAFYSYEKDVTTNQWSTTQGSATIGYSINNLLKYIGTDKTNSYGLNAAFHFVPEKATLKLNLMDQKVDGLMGINANATGAFALGRTNYAQYLSPAAVTDITDLDDTHITSFTAALDYVMAKTWKLTFGYTYEKYTFADAYTSGTSMFPQATLIFMKPDNGSYKANIGYVSLNYRW